MNRPVACLTVAGALALAGGAHAAPSTFVQHLLDVERARHPRIVQVSVVTQDAGKAPAPASMSPADAAPASGGVTVEEALHDVSGDKIGTLSLNFNSKSAKNAAVAKAVQTSLSKHLISAKNAVDPYPYSADYSPATFSQALVDKTAAKHPEVIILAIHSTPPGSKLNVISGSTIGRIGKPADEDDLRVIVKGSTNLEVAENGKRFEVELPLNDAKGQRIGALGVVFAYRKGEDKERLHAHAVAIRDEMARQIPSAEVLAKPH